MNEIKLAQVDEKVPRLALRAKEAAAAIGISERLLWSETKAGQIPHRRIGRTVVYPVHALQQYLNSLETGQPSGSDQPRDDPTAGDLLDNLQRAAVD